MSCTSDNAVCQMLPLSKSSPLSVRASRLSLLSCSLHNVSREDCHSLVSRRETHVKLSTDNAEGGQFTLLHKQCFPSSGPGWCRWWWSRNRSEWREDGMLHTLYLPKEEEEEETQAWQCTVRVQLWHSIYRGNFASQRLVCYSYPVVMFPVIFIVYSGAHNGHQTILHPRTYQSNVLLERWRGNVCSLSLLVYLISKVHCGITRYIRLRLLCFRFVIGNFITGRYTWNRGRSGRSDSKNAEV